MFGIFYEDINYAADGGLYAELVRNRSFEFNSSDNGSFTGMTAWQVAQPQRRRHHRHRRQRRRPPQRDEPQLPAADAAAAGDGVRNTGFNNGFAVKAGKTYDASVWARSTTAQDLTVRVEDTAGTGVLATGTVAVDGTEHLEEVRRRR